MWWKLNLHQRHHWKSFCLFSESHAKWKWRYPNYICQFTCNEKIYTCLVELLSLCLMLASKRWRNERTKLLMCTECDKIHCWPKVAIHSKKEIKKYFAEVVTSYSYGPLRKCELVISETDSVMALLSREEICSNQTSTKINFFFNWLQFNLHVYIGISYLINLLHS